MSFSLSQLLPGIETGLNKIGFLFGAGTSKEAGYPLMPDLTKAVVDNLSTVNKALVEQILSDKGLSYDPVEGTPNIEDLSDLVTEYLVATHDSKYQVLEDEIRDLIVENILSVSEPDLEYHIRFLEALKKRAQGTPTTVTLITTNYDVLFELAAGYVGLRVETGFDGPLRRLFDPSVFELKRGSVDKSRFSERPELHLNILKLHGSISWLSDGDKVFESGLDLSNASSKRAMILPRRRKVIETLADPFDQLFTRASRTLGLNCKYLVSCGFSFGDKHINDLLLFPKLQAGQIRLVALCGQEPQCLSDLMKFPAFHAGFPDKCLIDGNTTSSGTDLWKFSSLVELMTP
ncbi:SIR2 family protein [Methylophaga sulfidovorans]|uniref:SIR2-like domain-containing protein n=1 Tax=Methylophaga sulfidovorans TaxID=45496 RepID=A0A1I3VSW4_9GAMM|nr:SIR2 family protein [Methylophaga sulfidovorans]SFJ97377.1 SIR2-like domain-containing protein [Methylophaga sulfidovorans]